MSRLMRASEVIGRPVVTLGGEDVAQVKDVVYAARGGEVSGFTLAGRGPFSGPLELGLAWAAVMALGPDAVMIRDRDVMSPLTELLDPQALAGNPGGDVLGSDVLTDTGVLLGTVVDVILQVSDQPSCDVVGYEVSAIEPPEARGSKSFLPLPATLSASGAQLVVPASAKDFLVHDLAEIGTAAQAMRSHPEETS